MPLVSVVILTKNGEKTINKCLRSLFTQHFNDFEVLMIDSGSIDKTLKIASAFPVHIIKIKSSEFHHAKTRNLGLSCCSGKFVVFLTQDAYASDASWLESLIQPFNNPQVAATYSRQIPRFQTNPVERAFLFQTYPKLSRETSSMPLEQDNPSNFVVLSDVSSAYRKELVRFNSAIEWCEDQEMGLRLIQSGYEISYVPNSVVCHSHNYSFLELIKRYRAVGRAASKFSEKRYSPVKSITYAVRLFASTLSYITNDDHTNLKNFWLFYSIIYNILRISAFISGYLPKIKKG